MTLLNFSKVKKTLKNKSYKTFLNLLKFQQLWITPDIFFIAPILWQWGVGGYLESNTALGFEFLSGQIDLNTLPYLTIWYAQTAGVNDLSCLYIGSYFQVRRTGWSAATAVEMVFASGWNAVSFNNQRKSKKSKENLHFSQ